MNSLMTECVTNLAWSWVVVALLIHLAWWWAEYVGLEPFCGRRSGLRRLGYSLLNMVVTTRSGVAATHLACVVWLITVYG